MVRFFALALAPLLVLAGTVAVTAPAEAVPVCTGAGDVTLIGPGGCNEGPMNFFDFNVSPAGVAAKILLGTFSTVTGQQVNLNFQVSHDPSPANLADILFYYTGRAINGSTTLSAVDIFNPGHNVTIREEVCGTPFVGGTCASGVLADLIVPSNSHLAEQFPLLQSTIYVRKDIQLLQDSFISEFTNSHDLEAVPEPTTLLLLGSSLAALGAVVRRRSRKAQISA